MSNARTMPVELIAESEPRFAEEDNALLLVRLRAVTFLLSAGLALVLVRDLMFGRGPGWPFQAAATVAMVFLATLLSAARSGSERGLKAAEAAAFGLAAGVVAVHLWHAQLSATARGDATSLEAGSKDAVIGTTIVLFTYALLIPAPHGRAWRSIAAIAACPVATEVLLFLAHPEVFRLARRVATVQRVGETVSLLVIVGLARGIWRLSRPHHARPGARRPAIQSVSPPGRDRGRGDGRGLPRRASVAEATLRLKVIRPERAGDPRSLARFEHEVRATALLSDPNILEVYDYGRTADGTFFYVMEYLHGLTLESWSDATGRCRPAGSSTCCVRRARRWRRRMRPA